MVPEKGLFKKGIYKYSVSTKNELKAFLPKNTTPDYVVAVSIKNELKDSSKACSSDWNESTVSIKNELKDVCTITAFIPELTSINEE